MATDWQVQNILNHVVNSSSKFSVFSLRQLTISIPISILETEILKFLYFGMTKVKRLGEE
ncbi:hypothetical protein FD21_GL000459 [Liquorilactobacillus vini DSM 20605]|uniref:Uncharacterized protein n=1 Tax=Liquorilactobacillus vini DSM 20605 TaxID=1133569 RepID=A0A0R2CG69_9LACO|nr:hypothetical protein FD21_GL000459 [Liquorilactobacillus vini DSM 20605]